MYFHSFRDFASTETIDTSALATKKERLDNLDQANAEVEKLRKLAEKLTGELQGELYFIYVFLAIILHARDNKVSPLLKLRNFKRDLPLNQY